MKYMYAPLHWWLVCGTHAVYVLKVHCSLELLSSLKFSRVVYSHRYTSNVKRGLNKTRLQNKTWIFYSITLSVVQQLSIAWQHKLECQSVNNYTSEELDNKLLYRHVVIMLPAVEHTKYSILHWAVAIGVTWETFFFDNRAQWLPLRGWHFYLLW